METRSSRTSWFKRQLGTFKSYFKKRMKGKGKYKITQGQTRTESLVSEDTPVSHPDTEINPSTVLPLPSAISSDEPTKSLCTLSNHPIHERIESSGHSHHELLYTLDSSPPMPIGNSVVGTEASTGNASADSFKELLGPNQLWEAAYNKLNEEDPKALMAYQELLLTKSYSGQTDSSQPQSGDGYWQERIQRLAHEGLRANQEQRLSFHIGEKNVIVRDQLQTAMRFIVSAKDLVATAISSEPHAALAWAGVMFIFPLLNTMLKQDNDAVEGFNYISSLLIRCKLMEDDFLQPMATKSKSSEHDYKLALSLESKTIELYSHAYKYQIHVILHFDRSTPIRLLRDLGVRDGWKEMIGTLKAAENEINDDLKGLSNHTVKEIDKKLGALWFEAREAYERALESIQDIQQASLLGGLPVAHFAAFNSADRERQRHCTPGTRREILNQLRRWVESPTGNPILWLHGMAGTGKSTIAQTVATALNEKTPFADGTQLPNNISLGATFFFKRDDAERNRAGVLFTTIAHQLAHKPLGLEGEIAKAIKHASPSMAAQNLKNQWDDLILGPLKTLQKGSSLGMRLIFIIDALDECHDKETGAMKRDAQHIIQLLNRVEGLPEVQVRVLITSRHESYIDQAFKSLPGKSYDEIELPKVLISDRCDEKKDDITIFLEGELPKFEMNNGDGSKWPSPDDLRKLAEKAGGLFIYAATASKFLADGGPDLAKRRLRRLLDGSPNDKSPEATLSQVYSTVLDFYTRDWTDDEKQEDHLLKDLLGLIVVLFKPLPLCSLANFAKSETSAPEAEKCLESLRSVIDLPKDSKASVGIVHLSFREFLLDEQRCKETGFLVAPSAVHVSLFEKCLEIMSRDLHMDMCGLQKPGTFSTEVPSDLVQQCIPPHLQYACRYWVDHLLQIRESQQAQDALADGGSIHKFLLKHVLNWVEALGWMRELGIAALMIGHLEGLTNARERRQLSELVHGANRFVRFHGRIIQEAPLQVYYSAIMFSPATSIIRSLFLKPLTEWATRLPVVNNSWGTELLSLEGHRTLVSGVAISLDGITIVSGSSDHTARLWEAATGIETARITAPSPVLSVAISSNGKTVALGLFESQIQLYDVGTGETSDLYFDHRRISRRMAFSPRTGSTTLASLSEDGELLLWDVSSKQRIRVHEVLDHTEAVAFTPCGNLVAVVPGEHRDDGAVHVWNVETGELTTGFKVSSGVRSIALLTDGITVALVYGNRVERWNIETEAILGISDFDQGALVVALSPDGRLFVMISFDGTIHVRNLESGEEIRQWGSAVQMGMPVALSANRGFMASISNNRTIRLWDFTVSEDIKVIDEEGTPRRLTIATSNSNDFSILHFEEAITVWDLNAFEVKFEIRSTFVECSSNGKISTAPHPKGFYRSTGPVQLWDINTGKQLAHFKDAYTSKFSPDGNFMALYSKYRIQVLETVTWKERARFTIGASALVTVTMQFSNDNKVILWAPEVYQVSPDGHKIEFHLRNLETGYASNWITSHKGSLALSPNSTLAAVMLEEGGKHIYLFQVDTGEKRGKILFDEHGFLRTMSFSPDSTRIAVAVHKKMQGEIIMWDTATGNMTHTLQMRSLLFDIISISLVGKIAIKTFNECDMADVYLWDPVTNGPLHSLFHSYGGGLTLSEDSKYLEGPCGRFPLPSAPKDFDCLYVSDDWVLQGGERLLWLPKTHRPRNSRLVARGGTIFMVLNSGSITSIQIDLKKTPLAKQHQASSQTKKGKGRVIEVE